jgi:hypothetical protein
VLRDGQVVADTSDFAVAARALQGDADLFATVAARESAPESAPGLPTTTG